MNNNSSQEDFLITDGTNQGQRLVTALSPDFIKVDELKLKEILTFVSKLSKEINFFNLNGSTPGNWNSFFRYFNPDSDEISITEEEIISILESKSNFEPHYALFLTFVKLFQFAQDDLNTITQRHLDFYYKKVLQLVTKPAVSDKVHIIFELAKNPAEHLIAAGTELKAGKDNNGPIIYRTNNEIVINKAQIKSLKSIYIDEDNFHIYSAEVSNSADGNGKAFEGTDSKWSGFGENQDSKPEELRNMQEAKIGFAFASPMLLLKEGKRVVTLTISFKNNASVSGDISRWVEIFLSGEKEWVEPGSFSAKILDNNKLEIKFTFESIDPAIIPFDKTILQGSFDTEWPVLKVVLTEGSYLYHKLYTVEIDIVTIDVDVSGVKDLVIQNDESTLNPAKPFLPFGSSPTLDSVFYIGSAEVFQKQLSSLSLDILWNDVPQKKLGLYYTSIFDLLQNVLTNQSFTARISILNQDKWYEFNNDVDKNYFLFDLQDAKLTRKIVINFTGIIYNRNIDLQELSPFDNKTQTGFIKLEISNPSDTNLPFTAFGHSEYPNFYATKAIIFAKNPDEGSLPDPIYTPSIKSLSLNYSSTETIHISDDIEQFYYIEPFGEAKIKAEKPYLLTQYKDEANLEDEFLYLGNFYLGIENLVPPQNVSMLFQAVEGSADINTTIEDEDIHWSYLSYDQWIPVTQLQIIMNTTRGFQTSGIISLAIGSDATNNNTLMPGGLYWLRASVEKDPIGISRFIDVKTQAVEASYVIRNLEDEIFDDHFLQPLAPFSIKELIVKDSSLKSILQPYNSFDGKAEEKNNTFYTRVSERLRHKNRALTLWDYERLILNEFPSVFKIKCLTHTDKNSDLSAGAVTAVVVPNLINKNSVNPLQPKADFVTLQKIKEYISQYIPLFVKFEVSNPIYEQLLVDFKVGFIEGKDAGYYGNLLNEEIKKYLSPWAYEEGEDITFGGKIFSSDILAFIENRDYVDFVNDFKLYHIFDGSDDGIGIGEMSIGIDFEIVELIPPGLDMMEIGADFIIGNPVEVAYASGPKSILVSATEHRIAVLKTGEYQCSGIEYTGIDYMAISVDFIVDK